jgi:hypothetical protein
MVWLFFLCFTLLDESMNRGVAYSENVCIKWSCLDLEDLEDPEADTQMRYQCWLHIDILAMLRCFFLCRGFAPLSLLRRCSTSEWLAKIPAIDSQSLSLDWDFSHKKTESQRLVVSIFEKWLARLIYFQPISILQSDISSFLFLDLHVKCHDFNNVGSQPCQLKRLNWLKFGF